jgi:hypothetical protein
MVRDAADIWVSPGAIAQAVVSGFFLALGR